MAFRMRYPHTWWHGRRAVVRRSPKHHLEQAAVNDGVLTGRRVFRTTSNPLLHKSVECSDDDHGYVVVGFSRPLVALQFRTKALEQVTRVRCPVLTQDTGESLAPDATVSVTVSTDQASAEVAIEVHVVGFGGFAVRPTVTATAVEPLSPLRSRQ